MRAVIVCALAAAAVAAQVPSEKTVRDGVFTAAQAARGSTTYFVTCSGCHMDDLSVGGEFDMQVAPALARDGFMERRDLNSVFVFAKANMPADNPASLSDDMYLDVLAYVLQQNGFPAGKDELKPVTAALKNIRITSVRSN